MFLSLSEHDAAPARRVMPDVDDIVFEILGRLLNG